jgi:hypothetical protein
MTSPVNYSILSSHDLHTAEIHADIQPDMRTYKQRHPAIHPQRFLSVNTSHDKKQFDDVIDDEMRSLRQRASRGVQWDCSTRDHVTRAVAWLPSGQQYVGMQLYSMYERLLREISDRGNSRAHHSQHNNDTLHHAFNQSIMRYGR